MSTETTFQLWLRISDPDGPPFWVVHRESPLTSHLVEELEELTKHPWYLLAEAPQETWVRTERIIEAKIARVEAPK